MARAVQGEAPALLAELQFELPLVQFAGAFGHQAQGALALVDQQHQVRRQEQGDQPAGGDHQVPDAGPVGVDEVVAGTQLEAIGAVGEDDVARQGQLAIGSDGLALVERLRMGRVGGVGHPHGHAAQHLLGDAGLQFLAQVDDADHEAAQQVGRGAGPAEHGGHHEDALAVARSQAKQFQLPGNHRPVPGTGLFQQCQARRQGGEVEPQGNASGLAGDAVEHRQVVVARRAGNGLALAIQLVEAKVLQAIGTGLGFISAALASGNPRHPAVGQGVAQQRLDETMEFAAADAAGVVEEAPQGVQLLELVAQALLHPAEALGGDLHEALAKLHALGAVHGGGQQQRRGEAADQHQGAGQQEQAATGRQAGKQGGRSLDERLHAHLGGGDEGRSL